jgi:hypothetical protein
VTKIDRCSVEEGIWGETTAKPEAFVAAFKAAGFELGRDGASPDYADHWLYVRKGATEYRVDLEFLSGGDNRENPFFSISADKAKEWLPEATWQSIQNLPAQRDKLIERWRGVADVIGNKAPKECPALGDLDPAMRKAPTSFLLNIDAGDLAGTPEQRFARGPELFAFTLPEKLERSNMKDVIEAKAKLDALGARRIVPVIRMTKYDAPSVPSGINILGTFTPGKATFEVAVVDLVDKKLLCRSKAKAASSETIEATTYTRTAADGHIEDVSTSANAAGDLAKNIETAAFAELAKMSPAFAVN